MNFWPTWRENKWFALLLGIALVYFIVFLGAKINQSIITTKSLNEPVPFEHSILIDGKGTVTGTPDIATVSLGILSRGVDVATAQTSNSTSMNAMIEKIKAIGIADADIATSNYNVYEDQAWNPDTGAYISNGWIVSQEIAVKIRDTKNISIVLDTAGKNGATNITGPNFTLDNPSNLKAEARTEALADAKAKAAAIAKSLGVKIDGVIGYSEWSDDGILFVNERSMVADSVGGITPTIQPGSTEVTVNVTVTFKLAD